MRVLMATAGIGLMAGTIFVELRSSAGLESSTEGPSPAARPIGTGHAAYPGWAKRVLRDFENQDQDDDGRLSRSELELEGEEFADLDSDGDGYISPQELRRYQHRLRRPG